MMSVLTLTYKRKQLLEEAIYSFLNQNNLESSDEMVIINDNKDVEYHFNHSNIKIINLKERFESISSKIEWGYKQCKCDYIYRLDDDDLLAPWAIENTKKDILNNPNYDIYRSEKVYYFVNNILQGTNGSVNNGNIYTKKYLDRIKFTDQSVGEDVYITFENYGKIYESKLKPTMIYRWGMGTYHISAINKKNNKELYDYIDSRYFHENGKLILNPHFKNDYYKIIESID
jgi:hypothetical protein